MNDARASNGLGGYRELGVELGRIVGSILICWFHLAIDGKHLAYSGLPLFMIVSLAFTRPLKPSETWSNLLQSRARRLLVPYIKFFVFYAIIDCYFAWKNGDNFFESLGPLTLISGTSIHLWYLPAAFIATILAVLIHESMFHFRPRNLVVFIALVTLLGTFMFFTPANQEPVDQYRFIAPAVFIGIAIGVLCAFGKRKAAILSMMVLGTLLLILAINSKGENGLLPYSIGLFSSSVCLLCSQRVGKWIDFVGPMTFLVYLLHPFLSLVVAKLTPIVFPSNAGAALTIVLTFFVSIAIAMFPTARRVLL